MKFNKYALPWKQGTVLRTQITSLWSEKELHRNMLREKRCIYANFQGKDQGRGRELIAEFQEPRLAEAVEKMARLVEEIAAIESTRTILKMFSDEAKEIMRLIMPSDAEAVDASSQTSPPLSWDMLL